MAKITLVTGAARGIGLAAAKRFLADDWRVALLDIDGDNLARTFSGLATPDTTMAITCDVADPAGVARAVKSVAERFGRLDALVNTAGGANDNNTTNTSQRATTQRTANGTSKAGLAHLTKQQAAELASLGIRVNAVAPGPVDTALAKAVPPPEIRKDYHDHMPLI